MYEEVRLESTIVMPSEKLGQWPWRRVVTSALLNKDISNGYGPPTSLLEKQLDPFLPWERRWRLPATCRNGTPVGGRGHGDQDATPAG